METIKACVVVATLCLAACATEATDAEHFEIESEALGICTVPVNVTALDLYDGGEAVLTSTVGEGALTWTRSGGMLWLSPATLELGKWTTSSVMVPADGRAEIAIADLHGNACMYKFTLR